MKLKSIFFVNYFILPIVLLLATIKQTSKPYYNWDFVFYVGTLFNTSTSDITASRTQTIQALQKSKYIDCQNEVQPQTQYGIDVFTIDKAYNEQFPFYNIRIVYNSTIKAFHFLGADSVHAVYLSSLFYALLIIILFYYFALFTTKNAWFAFIITLFIILNPSFKPFITSSPDTLSAFAIICLTLSFVSTRRFLILAFSIFAILARTDNIVFVGILLAIDTLLKIKNTENYKENLINLLLPFMVYFIVNAIYKNTGYGLLFYHAFIDHLSYPISNPTKVSFAKWYSIMKGNILYLIHPFLYLLLCVVLITKKGWNPLRNPAMIVAITSIFTFSIKFIFFPSLDPRFVFQYLILTLIVVIFYFNKEIKKMSESLIFSQSLLTFTILWKKNNIS